MNYNGDKYQIVLGNLLTTLYTMAYDEKPIYKIELEQALLRARESLGDRDYIELMNEFGVFINANVPTDS